MNESNIVYEYHINAETDGKRRVDIYDEQGSELGYAIFSYDDPTGVLEIFFYENTAECGDF